MYSLILVTALNAVGDAPKAAPAPIKPAATKAATTTMATPYFGMPRAAANGNLGCFDFCPSDNVDLFLPCPGMAPCPPVPPRGPRPVAGPRVNTTPCPTPRTVCPCPPPPVTPPCP
jgi:hypothetical protein